MDTTNISTINGWICTDPDCSQYCKRLSKFVFDFIEIREFPGSNGEQYGICTETIDLNEYSFAEMWEYCSGYYNSFEEIVNTYGFKNSFQIVAECIFEQSSLCDVVEPEFEKANDFVLKWVKKF